MGETVGSPEVFEGVAIVTGNPPGEHADPEFAVTITVQRLQSVAWQAVHQAQGRELGSIEADQTTGKGTAKGQPQAVGVGEDVVGTVLRYAVLPVKGHHLVIPDANDSRRIVAGSGSPHSAVGIGGDRPYS